MGIALSNLPQGNPGGPWHLVLDEPFIGSALDTNRWALNWYSDTGTMNNVTTLKANQSVDKRGLVLKLSSGADGALVTTRKVAGAVVGFNFLYGFMEFACTIPNNNAAWVAGWTAGGTYGGTGYQEFDICEPFSGDGKVYVGNHHYTVGTTATATNDPSPFTTPLGVEHIYGMHFQPGQVDFYHDGTLHQSITTNLNTTGGDIIFNYGVNPSGDTSGVGDVFTVRYCKVWEH